MDTGPKTEYSNEIAIRLILGCLEYVAGRLEIQIIPQFVQHDKIGRAHV